MKALRYHPAARRDLQESASWYAGERRGLGREFIASAMDGIAAIAERPHTWPLHPLGPAGHEVRRRRLARFPYSVIYLVTETDVVVLAVARDGRKPAHWLVRLEEG